VTGDDSLVFLVRAIYIHFQYVIGQWKSIFQRSKRTLTKLLMSFELWVYNYFNHQKSMCVVTGGDSLMFVLKPLLYSISIYYWTMKNHFVQVKKISYSITYEL